MTKKNFRNGKLSDQRDFTLIEIIAIPVTLAILAVIAVPKYMSLVADSKNKAAMGGVAEGMGRVNQFVASYMLRNNGSAPATATEGPQPRWGRMPETLLSLTRPPAVLLKCPLMPPGEMHREARRPGWSKCPNSEVTQTSHSPSSPLRTRLIVSQWRCDGQHECFTVNSCRFPQFFTLEPPAKLLPFVVRYFTMNGNSTRYSCKSPFALSGVSPASGVARRWQETVPTL